MYFLTFLVCSDENGSYIDEEVDQRLLINLLVHEYNSVRIIMKTGRHLKVYVW